MRCPICDNEIRSEVYRVRKDLCQECDQTINETRNDYHEDEEEDLEDSSPVPKVWIKRCTGPL